jgi:hypothetical protein
MKPGDAYWKLVKPIWSTIFIGDTVDKFNKSFAEAPLAARTLFAAHWCFSEVSNGGFHQFFYNSTGVLAPEAVDSFRALGMPQTASVAEKAMEWFGHPYPRERRIRLQQIEAATGSKKYRSWQQFRPLDEEFCRLMRSENGGFLTAADTYALHAE